MSVASTPDPPYTAVIFTSVHAALSAAEADEYAGTSAAMAELAARQPGFLGVESARDGVGITVSYWRTAADARAWKRVAEHRIAQERGRAQWYARYRVRIATVEREYGS